MNNSIPPRIIQTAKSTDLPLIEKAASMNMKLINPEFEYLFFDNQQVEEFIDKHFPQYRETFDSFPIRIQKYDFFRYLAVYHFGGFYFDLDVFLATPLSDLLDSGCVFPFERLTWSDYMRFELGMDWEIGNYAFGAAPGHPFLRLIIENCVRAQKDSRWANETTNALPGVLRKELHVIYTTGPGMASRSLAEYRNKEQPVNVLFPKDVCDQSQWNLFGGHGIHLGEGSWRVRHNNLRKRLINFFGKRNEARALKLSRKLGPTRTLTFSPASKS